MQTCPAQTVPAIAVTTDPDASGAGAQKTAAMVPLCSHDGIWHLNAFE
jgi:hypothetical protein